MRSGHTIICALLLALTACGPKKMAAEKDGNIAPATDLRTAYHGWLDELAAASDPATDWCEA